jgi:parallel beta-helix repeat protein
MYTRSLINYLITSILFFYFSISLSGQSYTIDYSGSFSSESNAPIDVTLDDDELSTALPIGFSFVFFDNVYTEFYLSSNGFITFDSLACDVDPCYLQQQIPDSFDPNNLIALVWNDLNVQLNATYDYETVGTPGSRRLIVTISDYYDDGECMQDLLGQIWLYEGSNIIELHIETFDNSCYSATQGIENSDGTEAFYDPSRNDDFWSEFNDYIAFVPIIAAGNDAGAYANQSRYCPGVNSVFTLIKNYGGNDIDSVTVNWEWKGVPQTPVLFNAFTLAPGEMTGVLLDTMTFVEDSTYLVTVWTSNPNGVTDTVPANDTATATAIVSMQGSYTIGGVSPDYIDFASAIAAIALKLYCDTVIFNVRDGIYNEQVLIPLLYGVSGTNRVIFQSESGDSSSVTVVYNATNSDSNYVLRLDDADNITLKDITFEAVDMNFGRVIEVLNGSDSLEILNCHLKGYGPGSSSIVYAALYSTGSSDARIQNTRISQGSRGIHCVSDFAYPLPNNWQIINNIIDSITHWGIYMSNVVSPDIQYNIMRANNTSARSMLLSNIDEDFTVAYNRFDLKKSTRGIDIFNGNESKVGQALIHDNFIYSELSSLQSLYIAGSDDIGVYHNSISHYSSSATIPAFDINASLNITLRNNNIVNFGPGFAFATTSLANINTDYNNLRTNGVNLVSLNGFPHATLADWIAVSSMDSNSVSVDPMYAGGADLHTTQPALFRVGTAIPGIGIDIDGDVRHLTTPDIGADEVPGFDDNLAPLVIFPQAPFASGTQAVEVIVRNLGSNVVTSFNVDWTVNGMAQTQFVFAGALAGLASDTFAIGNVMFGLGTPYTIRTWTSMPNNTADAQPSNDTLQVDSLYAALGGTFTIGGASPDFDSIGHAVKAMTLGGVIDTTIFLLRTGTYAEAITFADQPGFKCDRPVVFESESGDSADVIWTDASIAGVPLTLSGADGLQFKNLTIQSVDGYVVYVDGESNCNRFEGCHFIGEDVTTTATSKTVVYSPGSRDTANVFINNTFEDGSYGLNWRSVSSLPYESGTIVKGNIFKGQRYRGLLLGWQEASSIIENVVTNTDIGTATYNMGIVCSRCQNDMTIERNKVQLTAKSSYGIYLELCTGTSLKTGLVANNFVQMGGTTVAYGIYVWSSTYQDIYYNSLKITGTHTSSTDVYAVTSGTNNVRLHNNILVNESGGQAIRLFNETQLTISDNNNLLSSGNLALTNIGTYADLAAWQLAGFDANSMSVDPFFVDSLDLHVLNINLNAAATPVSSVTNDIDNDIRDLASPDIGADEFVPLAIDAGLSSIVNPSMPFPSGLNTVAIKFYNNGINNLTTLQVNWEVDGVAQTPYMWTGSLASGVISGSLEIGSFDFAPFQSYNVKVWVSNPNGMVDSQPLNDTIEVNNLYPALLGTYTIGGASPDANNLSDAFEGLGIAGILGPVTFNIRDGVYTDSLVINAYPGMDCNTPVVIQSESQDSSKVTISNAGIGAYVLTLNGADGLIIQHLTLEAANISFRRVVNYFGGSDCNVFRNNHLKGYESTSTSSTYAVVYSVTGADIGNVFENNLISYGGYGFSIRGGNNQLSGTIIRNNNITSSRARGIDVYREDGIVIEGNSISNTGYTLSYGIYMSNCDSAVQVTGNTIIGNSGRYGIYTTNCKSDASHRSLFANNFSAIGGTSTCYAFNINGSTYMDFAFNSGHNFTSKTNNTNNRVFNASNCNNIRLYDNVFFNSSVEGEVMRFNNAGLEDANYNCYSNMSSVNYILYNGVPDTTLAGWQMSSGLDSNSLDTDPMFVADTNLHTSVALLDEAGTPIAGVSIDIDGDVRDALLPDIGADEFTLICDTCWLGGIAAYVDSAATGANDGTSWTNAYNDLQDALLAAKSFPQITQIWIANGTYMPTAGTQRNASFILNDTMELYGGFAGGEVNLVDRDPAVNTVKLSGDIGIAGDSTDNVYQVVFMSSGCTACLLDGVTVTRGNADGLANVNDRGAGVLSMGTGTLRDLIIEYNTSSASGGAVFCSGGQTQLTIDACILRFNTSLNGQNVLNTAGAGMNVKGDTRVEDD